MTAAARLERVVYPTCQAPHPDRRKDGQACGAPLGAANGPLRFVGLRKRFVRDHRTFMHCPRCKAWNVFEPAETDDGDAR